MATTYFVDYLGEAEGWGIKKSVRGGTEFISGHETKRAAVAAAKNHARPEGAEVAVENKSTGQHRKEADYSSTTSSTSSRSSGGHSPETRTTKTSSSSKSGPSLPGLGNIGGGVGGSGGGDPPDMPPLMGGDDGGQDDRGDGPSVPGLGIGMGPEDDDDDDEPLFPF